jgi:hypothetical protein
VATVAPEVLGVLVVDRVGAAIPIHVGPSLVDIWHCLRHVGAEVVWVWAMAAAQVDPVLRREGFAQVLFEVWWDRSATLRSPSRV